MSKLPTHRILATQYDAARLAARAHKLRCDADADNTQYGRPTKRAMAIMCQRGADRLYQKARALMGLEDHAGWVYTNGY